MPRTSQKQKVKDTRTELEKFYRCSSTSHLRNPLSFNCYQRQNLTMEYFQMSHLPSRAVHIFQMVTRLISKGRCFEEVTSCILSKFDFNHRYKGVSF